MFIQIRFMSSLCQVDYVTLLTAIEGMKLVFVIDLMEQPFWNETTCNILILQDFTHYQ